MKLNTIVPFLEKKQRLADDLVEIMGHELRRRQARELGKLVDEILELFDLLNDRGRAFIENPAVAFRASWRSVCAAAPPTAGSA